MSGNSIVIISSYPQEIKQWLFGIVLENIVVNKKCTFIVAVVVLEADFIGTGKNATNQSILQRNNLL